MGRRSINTTKSGKYMNPTDQARKEARKKELKKNKRQRQIVRTAVLKGKDPVQLLSEMEKIDQMEFNAFQPSPLNEKVLKEKRKKLRDTFDRVMKMYQKEDTEKWNEMRTAEAEYIKARNRLVSYYEAIKSNENGENVEIPIPPMEGESFADSLSHIPLPVDAPELPLGILRKKSAYSPPSSPHRTFRTRAPPGVPPGPPPVLLPHEYGVEDESDSSDNGEDSTADGKGKQKEKRTIRFVDLDSKEEDKNFSSAGQDIDVFMKEMEEVHKKRAGNPEQIVLDEASQNVSSQSSSMLSLISPLTVVPPHIFRPPPLIVGPVGIRLPPGPPPGRPSIIPPGPPPGLPRLGIPGMRLPMMPPSGNPRLIRFSVNPIGRPGGPRAVANVVTAGPQLVTREEDNEVRHTSTSATIEAKAQIRNLNADITRFLPTSVRVKRDDKSKTTKQERKSLLGSEEPVPYVNPPESRPTGPFIQQSKDDAYMQFMKEMQGLL